MCGMIFCCVQFHVCEFVSVKVPRKRFLCGERVCLESVPCGNFA
jgi:hypothetical protein